jgi:hypothetical protein
MYLQYCVGEWQPMWGSLQCETDLHLKSSTSWEIPPPQPPSGTQIAALPPRDLIELAYGEGSVLAVLHQVLYVLPSLTPVEEISSANPSLWWQ